MDRIVEESEEDEGTVPPSSTSLRRRSPSTKSKRVSFSASGYSNLFASFTDQYGDDNAEDFEDDKENAKPMILDPNVTEQQKNEHRGLSKASLRPTISRLGGELELETSGRYYHGPTTLHRLCHDAKSSDDFPASYSEYGAANLPDDEGKLPLHILGENRRLAISVCGEFDPAVIKSSSSLGSTGTGSRVHYENQYSLSNIQSFLYHMLQEQSLAVVTPDYDEFFPFEYSLQQWILEAYSHTRQMVQSNSSKSIFSRTWMNTSMSVSNAFVHVGKSFTWSGQDDSSSVPVVDVENKPCGSAVVEEFPKHVRISSSAMFAIQMLSHIVEFFQDTKISPSNRDTVLQEMMARFAAIPNLFKTMLLVESDVDRQSILRSTFVRHLATHKSTVGPWLTSILNADRSISRMGVQYLAFVSELPLLEEFYETMSNLEGFIPSLLGLDELSIEKAATTGVVKNVMDRAISKPFCVGVVFFDGIFLAILIIGFRAAVNALLTGDAPSLVLRWIYVANTGIFYFLIRELGKAITILERTKQATIYLWSFWNVTDILSTVLALASVVTIRLVNSQGVDVSNIEPLRVLLAITTGLLWLRVLSLLKTLNIQLATFVLAIIQITRDILWFCVILAVVVASFSQMFYTLLLPASCATASISENEVCSKEEYYLRTFTVLLGDQSYFAKSNYKSAFSVFLIVFFSFMVVIVLLNVLIAIVSDSYEKCLVRSHYLFGRTRVMLIAELVSFQNLLRTEKDGHTLYSQWWSGEVWNRWSRGSVCFFLLSSLVVFIWVVGETVGYFSGERNANYIFSLLSVFVIIALYFGIIVFLSNAGDEKKSTSWYKKFIEKTMFRLLASSRDTLTVYNNDGRDEWRGRVDFLAREMLRISAESNAQVSQQVGALEHYLNESSEGLRQEISNVESQLAGFKEEIMMELKQMEARNTQLLRQASVDSMKGTHCNKEQLKGNLSSTAATRSSVSR